MKSRNVLLKTEVVPEWMTYDYIKIATEAAILWARRVNKFQPSSAIWETQLDTKRKTDATLKTRADEASERAIIWHIRKSFPSDIIYWEESGEHVWTSNIEWFIDPLDGTSSFVNWQNYSTVWISVYKDWKPFVSNIVHPFEKKILIAEQWKWAYSADLDINLWVDWEYIQVNQSQKPSNPDATVYMDALMNRNNTILKTKLIQAIQEQEWNIWLRMTGSNIDQQFQVALKRWDITLTDVVGWFYDLAAGALIIQESWGIFVDAQTWWEITSDTKVAVWGSKEKLESLKSTIQDIYQWYKWFNS